MPDLFESSVSSEKYSARQIEILEGLDPVRHRPGMYIGGTDQRAMHHLVAELLDNSMDEAVAGQDRGNIGGKRRCRLLVGDGQHHDLVGAHDAFLAPAALAATARTDRQDGPARDPCAIDRVGHLADA